MFQHMIEFFEYMNSHVETGSLMVGFFICMLFDVLFSATSCFLEKSFEIMGRRKEKKKNIDNEKNK